MYEITVRDTFNALHRVRLADGQWEPVHGHDWQVVVAVAADELDQDGMVADFVEVRSALRDTLARLQYAYLNELPMFGRDVATAERVARVCHDALSRQDRWGGKVRYVEVIEAPGCTARYVSGGATSA